MEIEHFRSLGNKLRWASEAQPSEEAIGRAIFESICFVSQCLGRFAFSEKTVHKREPFMDDLIFVLHAILWQIAASHVDQQRFCLYLINEFNTRADEYSQFDWGSADGAPNEYGKKLMRILWGEVDAFRLAGIAAIELRSLRRLTPLVQSIIEDYEASSP